MLMQIAVENAPLGEIELLCTGTQRVPPTFALHAHARVGSLIMNLCV